MYVIYTNHNFTKIYKKIQTVLSLPQKCTIGLDLDLPVLVSWYFHGIFTVRQTRHKLTSLRRDVR